MTIKKAYVELIAFLEANSNRKVSTILAEAKEMCEAKNSGGSETGSTFIKDANEETVAIFCYYFKKWMPLCDVEFGKKASTATGYNTMCKEGVSNWTKQQRKAKVANTELLDKVASGDIEVTDIAEHKANIEAERKSIVEFSEPTLQFDTAEDVLAYINEPADEVSTVDKLSCANCYEEVDKVNDDEWCGQCEKDFATL